MYDPVTNTWTKLEQMPTKRSGSTSVSIGNISMSWEVRLLMAHYRLMKKYDTKTNMWTSELPVPTPSLGLRAVAVSSPYTSLED